MDNGRPAGHGVVGKAFYKSLPVMAGYVVLGIGFGILLRSAGYGVIWALAMSVFIYAGSMQYVGVGLLAGGASVITTALYNGARKAVRPGGQLPDPGNPSRS